MIKTLRGKLTVSYLAIMLLTISFLGTAFNQMMQSNLIKSAEQDLLMQAGEMAKGIAPDMARENIVPAERLITTFGQWSPSYILVTNETGTALFSAREMTVDLEGLISRSVVTPTLKNNTSTQSVVNMPKGAAVAVGVPIIYHGRTHGALVLFKNLTDIRRIAADTLTLVLQAALVSGALILVLSILLAGRMTGSIREIGLAVEDIAEGNLKRRIRNPGADEIGELAGNVNLMSERLEILVEKLKTQERNRRDLMANISHEFRTPITTIRGFAEALLDGLVGPSEEKERYYRIIYRQAAHIEYLTRDMLEYSKLESGQAEMKFQRFDLLELTHRLQESLEALADHSGLSFSVYSAAPQLYVIGDQQRIAQVITNLVDNAVSFTPAGGSVRICLDESDTEVRCQVSDNGIGIPANQLERVWHRFYRQERPRNDDYHGTGLGLPIVHQIIEAHGGRVWVDSEVGRGSSFGFSLIKADN